MDKPQLDHQSVLKTLDQLSQTVDVMSNVINRLQNHVELLMQQRDELADESFSDLYPHPHKPKLH